MRSQGDKGFSKMAATAKDDATATFKGDDEKDFGQEAIQEKTKAKGDDAEASEKTLGKATKYAAKNQGKNADGQAEDDDDAAKNRGKDADGEADSDEEQKEAFVSPEEPFKDARMKWEARVQAMEA